MSHKTFKCQVCPVGCTLSISHKNDELTVEGNKCSRGLEYAKSVYETSPQILFGRCLLSNASMGRLPVKTSEAVPSNLKNEVMEIIRNTSVKAPIIKGQVIIKNILDLNIDVISMRKVL
jgi:CxxC motif-containing protein